MNSTRQDPDYRPPDPELANRGIANGSMPNSTSNSGALPRASVHSMTDNEPSLGDLVMEITDDLTTLVRKEVDLAKVELQENLKEGAQAGGKVAAGGMVAYAGLLFILAAIAIALGDWWENYWLAAAVVGLVTAIVGGILLNGGINQLKEVSLVPHKAIASLERDAKMAKEKLT
jgi:hypothetical protein